MPVPKKNNLYPPFVQIYLFLYAKDPQTELQWDWKSLSCFEQIPALAGPKTERKENGEACLSLEIRD